MGAVAPIPLLTSPLKGEELLTAPSQLTPHAFTFFTLRVSLPLLPLTRTLHGRVAHELRLFLCVRPMNDGHLVAIGLVGNVDLFALHEVAFPDLLDSGICA